MHRRLIAQCLVIIVVASLVWISFPTLALAGWSLAAPLSEPRAYHTASVLPDGRVLLVGGARDQGSLNTLSSTDIFDPVTNSWSPDASMSVARLSHRAVTLADGRIMVVGGNDNGDNPGYNNAEVYDPASDSWSNGGTLSVGRRGGHTATLLGDGRVLVTGGYWFDGVFGNDRASAEIYTPATNSWTTVASMTAARSNHTATLLQDGRVLVAGQPTCGDCGYPSAELYDPVSNTWSPAGAMVTPRVRHTATLLNDGRVLVVGGENVTTVEIYDPITNGWSFAGDVGRREDHTATLLNNGRVLVAGSIGPGTGLPSDPSTLIFDPTSNTWSAGDPMSIGRGGHTATLLADGRVLVAGGRSEHTVTTVNSTELLVSNLPADSTTMLTSSGAAVYGQPVTFTATLTSAAGTPTGSVDFFDGTTRLGTATLSGGVASFPTAALAVGSHSISAVYGGDGTFAGSASNTLNQVIISADTTTSLTTSGSPSDSGQPVTFTANVAPVAPGAGTPSGTVTFKDGTATLGSATLTGGTATFTTTELSSGNHSISASYAGDTNFNASVSASVAQVVNSSGGFVVIVTPSVDPSVYGQAVTFTASVGIAPTGKVTFMDGTRTLGTKNLSQGSASLTITNLSAGSHTITAVYDRYVSPPLTQVVNQASTSTTLTASPTPSVFGQTVTLTATIGILPPGGGTLTGTITFLDGATVLGTKNVSRGQATLKIKSLDVGRHTLTATYGGTPNYSGSASPALTQVVNPAGTNTTLAVTSNPSVSGQKVTFTATVKAIAPGAGTPSGNVTFYDGTAILGSQPLANGKATLATTALSVGSHTITAAYSGSASFASSTSAALSQAVDQASSTTTLTARPNPAAVGQRVTFTATVKAVAPGAGTPGGSVTFMDGTTVLGSIPLVSGKATLATTSLALGSHTITAVYSGDPNFAPSTSAGLVQTIR